MAIAALWIATFGVGATFGQFEESPAPSANDSKVVAQVADFEITQSAVDRELQRILGQRRLSKAQRDTLWQTTRQQMIDRHVVYDYLRQKELAPGPSELQVQREALVAELAKYDQTLEDYLKDRQFSEDEFNFSLAYPVAWKRYTDRMLTDENLEKHYQNNRRRLDGTSLKVAHLLLKGSDQQTQENVKRAEQLRQKIEQGELKWGQAVAEHSAASTENEGELGWIWIDRPMPPAFTNAAFELEPGKISPPVVTSFGVHLIRCLEVKPGTLGWRDAREAVTADAERFLFRTLAKQHRDNVAIKVKD